MDFQDLDEALQRRNEELRRAFNQLGIAYGVAADTMTSADLVAELEASGVLSALRAG